MNPWQRSDGANDGVGNSGRQYDSVHVEGGRITHVVLQNKVTGRMMRRKMNEMALLLITKLSSVEISRSVIIPT